MPKTNPKVTVKAYRGDAKSLLAFNLPKAAARNLAGFTIQCQPGNGKPYYLLNNLQYEHPGDHAQDPTLPANSSLNAPIYKFRWLHVPGSANQGTKPFYGTYTYTVTPRYFDQAHRLLPIDPVRSRSVTVLVEPFVKGKLAIGFTRGFTQSQAFVRHFTARARIRPDDDTLLFDTTRSAGVSPSGAEFTYRDEYDWLGFTARDRVFELLDLVLATPSLSIDVFAYDLNEPDLMEILLTLAQQGRVRIILDNSTLHHAKQGKAEDRFEKLFRQAAKGRAAILRGKFARYAHDKVIVVYRKGSSPEKDQPLRVLTGSTNFSVTGLYVNSNHVLVFDDPNVARTYAEVFDLAWRGGVTAAAFRKSTRSTTPVHFAGTGLPATDITFAPHDQALASKILGDLALRIQAERNLGKRTGSVLFAVMQIDKGVSPVYPALRALHSDGAVFSYGISDSPGGIYLYRPGTRRGVLVTGKPLNTILPKPFNQVPNIGGIGHQVHHKFVVCGFNGPNPVVYCGSSNLAVGGEVANGDNLLAIRDRAVATVFAIEAIALVDHFDFLDRVATGPKATGKKPAANKQQQAIRAGWFLPTRDTWTARYFDPQDLRSVDRNLFG